MVTNLNVAFYSNRIQFDGDILKTKGTGGSESALVNITNEWKKNYPDDNIIVYNGIQKRRYNDFNNVIYKTLQEFNSDIRTEKFDALISLRDPEPFGMTFINSKVKCLWSQDDMNEEKLIRLLDNKYSIENIDCIFAVSEYSKNEIQKGFPNKEVLLLRNGYNEDWIKSSYYPRPPIAMYNSTPFRGLDILLVVWKEIFDECKKRNVNPELKIFSGMSLYNQSDDNFKSLYDQLNKLPNVKVNKPIPQKELYSQLWTSKVLLYPNHFLETSCMAVLEALSNGCWVVTTNLGALSEQVKHNSNGYLINGDSRTKEYQEQFIEYSVESLCNDNIKPNNNGLIFSWKEQNIKMRNFIKERI